ncbi:MAG: choice-of-anchor D domain-containing protein [Actinomycetota bacterium]|nr:choice-of-anchor D domain-containing protein [Actinomycetota bacterium]
MAVGIAVVAVAAMQMVVPRQARAVTIGISSDNTRTGWYSNVPKITPYVAAHQFGQKWSSAVDGQVFAQPLVVNGTIVVATIRGTVYGLSAATGVPQWSRKLGTAFNNADIGCPDPPFSGIVGTPVADSISHPGHYIAFLISRTYASGTSGPAAYFEHAVDVATGQEQPGFPVALQGSADNDHSSTFDPTQQLQRPGLLLLNGVVYAGFGSFCDTAPYEGWVIGVSATTGAITTRWTDEPGAGRSAGIWQSGAGLMSDGANEIFLSNGNGTINLTAPVAGTSPPPDIGGSIVHLQVQKDGSLKAVDFFTPYNSIRLNNRDLDVGSGVPVELPPAQFGTAFHPRVLVQGSKQGYLYMLDRNHLGGYQQGAGGDDAVLARLGPIGGTFGTVGVWPGDGGYVYAVTGDGGNLPAGTRGALRMYKYGLDGAGNPTLDLVGSSPDHFGFGSSGPIVTSTGTTTGTAVVWVIWAADSTGANGQLRAYSPIPDASGHPVLLYSAPIGLANKFTLPTIDRGHVIVPTRDGHILAFGGPATEPVAGSPVNFAPAAVGTAAPPQNEVVTAQQKVTISSVTSSDPAFSVGPVATTLPKGAQVTIPVTFTPSLVGRLDATLTVVTSAGTIGFSMSGTGLAGAATMSTMPTSVGFGMVTANFTPVTTSVRFSNTGATHLTISSATGPSTPFSASGLPAGGSTLAPGQSVISSVTFSPTAPGTWNDQLQVVTSAGTVVVPLNGNSPTPAKLVVSTNSIDFGAVPVGTAVTKSFTVGNTGQQVLIISASNPPSAGKGFTATTSLLRGDTIQPGKARTETVQFTPTTSGPASDTWTITAVSGAGTTTITFTGSGS